MCYHITEDCYELIAEIRIREGEVVVPKDDRSERWVIPSLLTSKGIAEQSPAAESSNRWAVLLLEVRNYVYRLLGFAIHIDLSQSGATFRNDINELREIIPISLAAIT